MAKNNTIYLDYNATTPIRGEVIEFMSQIMMEGGNPSSVHRQGRKAKARLEQARLEISTVINCRPQMIIFTSGGTEANNMAIFSCGRDRLITTTVEHDSIITAADQFKGNVDIVPVDQNGLVNISKLTEALATGGDKAVLSIIYANNETGVLQNITEIVEIAHEQGTLVHIDAIQAFGKVPLDFMKMGVDMMSISAHKIGGPQGVGALIAREKLPIKSMVLGGGQESGRRGGTENMAGIAGFGLAARLVEKSFAKMEKIKEWRDDMERQIINHAPNAQILGKGVDRLPNVSNIYMPGVKNETQVMNFDLDNICISAGSACSSGKVKASHVSLAMTDDENIASCTIRMSMGWASEKSDVEAFTKSWIKQYDRKKA